MSFPLISRLDFGRSLTFVRFVAAFVFFAMIFVSFPFSVALLLLGMTPGSESVVAVILL